MAGETSLLVVIAFIIGFVLGSAFTEEALKSKYFFIKPERYRELQQQSNLGDFE